MQELIIEEVSPSVEKFLSYEQAKVLMAEKEIRTMTLYKKFIKDNPLAKLPFYPQTTYRTKGWINWRNFLCEKFFTYEVASSKLFEMRIKTYDDYISFIRKNPDKGFHSSPNKYYKREWLSWGEFLGTGNVKNTKKIFISFDECKEIISKNKITNFAEYELYRKSNPSPMLHSSPWNHYRNCGYIDHRDFFGKSGFVEYKEARKIIKKNKIITRRAYVNFVKNNPTCGLPPTSPKGQYKNHWKDWGHFLGTNSVPKYSKTFYSFQLARKIIKKLKLTTIKQYIEFYHNDPNCGLPRSPDKTYNNKGWVGWKYYLGVK